jgi:nitrite reductase/ring-hydroxylating ferredoxin subunit
MLVLDPNTGNCLELAPGIYRARRAKLTGPCDHYGVVFSNAFPIPDGKVYEMTSTGPKVVSFSKFASGKIVTFDIHLPPTEASVVLARIEQLVVWKGQYHGIENNCEHHANYAMMGEMKSGQVSTIAILIVAAAAS